MSTKPKTVMYDKIIKYILVTALVVVFYLLIKQRYTDEDQAGYAEGMRVALKTNPPSEELEMVCAGLWVGEQNKKAWKKENAR
jgi:hypothetical protein